MKRVPPQRNIVNDKSCSTALFGSAFMDPGTGILMNNRMTGFRVDPADPRNVAPRKRPSHTLNPVMVRSTGTFPMNRKENLFALEVILRSMSKVNPESQTMKNLRRVAYLHHIVEAVLNEQVSSIPQTTEIYR